MENTLTFYMLILLANIWMAASHCANTGKTATTIIGTGWLLGALIFGFHSGVL